MMRLVKKREQAENRKLDELVGSSSSNSSGTKKRRNKSRRMDDDDTSSATMSLLSEEKHLSKEKQEKKSKKRSSSRKRSKGKVLSSEDEDDLSISKRSDAPRSNRRGRRSSTGSLSVMNDKKKKKKKKRSGSLGPLSGKSKKRTSKIDKGYDSDGVLGDAKAKARAARADRRAKRELEKLQQGNAAGGYDSDGVLGNAKFKAQASDKAGMLSPISSRKQAILDDMDALEHQESATALFLQQQVETLQKQVDSLLLEKKGVKKKLVKEIEKNDELEQTIRVQGLALITQEEGEAMEKLRTAHLKEKAKYESLLQDKDLEINGMKVSINEMMENKQADDLQHKEKEVLLLQEKIAIQKKQIDDLTIKLSDNHNSMDDEIHILKEQLKQADRNKVALRDKLKSNQEEHEVNVRRKDETILYFQNELTKLKQSRCEDHGDSDDKSVRNPYLPSSQQNLQNSQHPLLGARIGQSLTNLVSPFKKRETVALQTSVENTLLTPL